jgi:hypothetical protein
MATSKGTFNELVETLATLAASMDWSVDDAASAVWDGIRDAGYTWAGEPVSEQDLNSAAESARKLTAAMKSHYDSIIANYLR